MLKLMLIPLSFIFVILIVSSHSETTENMYKTPHEENAYVLNDDFGINLEEGIAPEADIEEDGTTEADNNLESDDEKQDRQPIQFSEYSEEQKNAYKQVNYSDLMGTALVGQDVHFLAEVVRDDTSEVDDLMGKKVYRMDLLVDAETLPESIPWGDQWVYPELNVTFYPYEYDHEVNFMMGQLVEIYGTFNGQVRIDDLFNERSEIPHVVVANKNWWNEM